MDIAKIVHLIIPINHLFYSPFPHVKTPLHSNTPSFPWPDSILSKSMTMIIITQYADGVRDSPIEHGIIYGDETYTLIAEVRLLGGKDSDCESESDDESDEE